MNPKLKQYIFNFLIWFDIGCNVIFMGGDPNETISSRCGKIVRAPLIPPPFPTRKKPKFCKFCTIVCYFLRKIDPNHCVDAIQDDEGKDQL